MSAQSIFTENSSHKPLFDNHDNLTISLEKGKQVPLATTLSWIPQQTRLSGAFNDFNKEFKKVRGMNHPNPMRLPDYMGGNNAKGLFKASQEDYFSKDETLKLKFKPRRLNLFLLDPVETTKQEQRTTQGTEIRGKETALDKKVAQREVDYLYKKKRNRGGRSGGKEGGAYQGGQSFNDYNKDISKQDNTYKALNQEQDEFRSIIEGEIAMSGQNATIAQAPE